MTTSLLDLFRCETSVEAVGLVFSLIGAGIFFRAGSLLFDWWLSVWINMFADGESLYQRFKNRSGKDHS